MARLSVLHVAEAFGGGVFEIVKVIAERSARRGYRVAIAYGTRPETPLAVRDEIDPAVELIPMPWTSRSVAAQAKAALALRALDRRWRPQVVHLHSSFAGVLGAVALGPVRRRTVYTPQAYASERASSAAARRTLRLVERFVARRVAVVGAASENEARLARELYGARNVETIANGVPELDEDRSTVPSAERERLVVALGRPVPQRQPQACARILRDVADLAEVSWIGGGYADGPGARALSEAGVSVTGWLPHETAQRRLASATAYLHWTAWDGLPLSVLEAMAHDVVVVASDIGPNREVLDPRQICSTEEEAVALIRRVLSDGELARSLVCAQRARRGHYSADRMVEEWLALYRSLAGVR